MARPAHGGQDLGLRLTAAGWLNRQDVRAVVAQQGLPGLRPLLRQRTRWAQGNLQAFGLAGALARAPLPLLAWAEVLAHLFMPLWHGIMAVSFAGAVALAVLAEAPFWGPTPGGRSPSPTCWRSAALWSPPWRPARGGAWPDSSPAS